LNSMPHSRNIEAAKILEINVNHDIFKSLKETYEKDKEKLELYTRLLYNQALLIEGLPVSDPVEFSNEICRVMCQSQA
jgi:molecular chaperone HtpG